MSGGGSNGPVSPGRDRVVVVTGGSLGIGKATAVLAGRRGFRVAICDISDADGQATLEELRASGATAQFHHLDVSRETDVTTAFDAIRREWGPIYGLVNNAGIAGPSGPTHSFSEADWDRVMAVNVKGVFLCTKHAVPDMMAQTSGSIVNLSSVYGLVGAPDVPAYHASKGAVRLMTKTDALLYARSGIRVNSVHPGFIDTPMVQHHADSLGARNAVYEQLARLHPMGRMGRPEEIAEGIAFLLSDASSFMTGSELVLDGGYTCQ